MTTMNVVINDEILRSLKNKPSKEPNTLCSRIYIIKFKAEGVKGWFEILFYIKFVRIPMV